MSLISGMMQCGPASVAAIKEGQLHLNHDAKFIYAEVNGIKVTWEVSPKMQYTVTDLDYNSVGTRISTKAVLEDKERLDITEEYKYTTGVYIMLDSQILLKQISKRSLWD